MRKTCDEFEGQPKHILRISHVKKTVGFVGTKDPADLWEAPLPLRACWTDSMLAQWYVNN